MKRHFRIWLVFLSASLSAGSASLVRAQNNVWSSIGPEAPQIRTLAVDTLTPSTLYAGTYGSGVFKSVDGGRSWSAMNNGLGSDITSLVIDPITPTTLYAGTEKGAFKSVDGGASWGAILVDGEPQKTRKDGQGPTDNLVCKRAGKNIASGQTVVLQVKNSDGTLSREFSFTRLID